jgi:hypothetical protein
VGSTTQSLSKRFGGHKLPSNRSSSKQIIDLGDAYIELIENYRCDSKEELMRREGEVIRRMDCVNKRIAGRTRQQYYQDNIDKIKQHYQDNIDKTKQYYQNNTDKSKQYSSQYYQNNTDKIKQYLKDNADRIKQKKKLYQTDNANKIQQYQKQYRHNNAEILKINFECECGSIMRNVEKSKHYKSKKHKFYQETYDYIYS